METLRDLIEEAKVRFVWWAICIFSICYFLSHTSKSMWMNVPISLLFALGLRILMNELEFHRKVPPIRKQTYLSYLEKKQLSTNDSRLSTALPPQKWKKKIDSPVIQAAVEEFIDLILRDFVTDLWYTDITPDREAPQLMRTVILDALGEVAGRVKEVNLVDLLTRDMIDLVGDHLELYRRNQTEIGVDVMGTLSSEERDERLKHHLMASKELHPALVSPECEYKFLKQLMGAVLAVVLRQREAQCPLVRTIARELLTCLVIQPVLNLASPVYINELIEFIILNFDDVLNSDGAQNEASNHSSNSSKTCTVAVGTLNQGQSSTRKDIDILKVESHISTEKLSNRTNKSIEGRLDFPLNASHGDTIQLKSADWARVLDAANQRRTEVLAPENLENMWARGRNYKDKLNKAAKKNQAKKGLAKADVALTSDLKKATSVNKHGNNEVENKALVHIPQGSCLRTDANTSSADTFLLSQSLGDKSAVREGLLADNACIDVINAASSKNRLKRSNSTSSKIEPEEKRPNTFDNKGIIISEFYSSEVGRHSDQRPPLASNPVIHSEASHMPKLRSRVLGAYFEKLGSNSFAVYSVAVTDSENNTWFVKRRYRNFERLHRHLKDIPNYTLQLPPKRIFSSSTEDAFVHQRCIQLDKYLQDLLSIANVAEQHEVWDFLSESSKNYSFGKSSSVMRTLAVNVDDAVDDIVRQFKGVSGGLMRKVVGGPSSSPGEFSDSSMPQRYLSWHADDYRSQSSMHSSIEHTQSSSDDEEVTKDQCSDDSGTQTHGWHSDTELDAKEFRPRKGKELKECKSLESKKKPQTEPISEPKENRTAISPFIFDPSGEPVAVPPEWTPPNVCVPALNLVDKIFQLNRRGWLRRQVFWISKQILQVVMEDAVDDFLLGQINWLRRDDVIAHGIRWIQDVLWPGGKFFLKLELSSGNSDGMQYQGAPSHSHYSRSKLSQSGSFEAQLEAVRRANDVKKLLFNGAPATLVSLIGHKQYKRCARDIYYFLQSTICIKQLAYGGLELVIISIFPELREVLLDIHKNMRAKPL